MNKTFSADYSDSIPTCTSASEQDGTGVHFRVKCACQLEDVADESVNRAAAEAGKCVPCYEIEAYMKMIAGRKNG